MRLQGKVAIITGASSGIGAATAERFAMEGAKVVIVARRKEKLDEIVNQSKGMAGEIYAVAGDVSKDKDIEHVVKETVDKYGRIDILVNNAGILDRFLSVEDMDFKLWDQVLDVNLTGPLKMIKAVLPHMQKNNYGSIVNTASIGGLYGGRGGAAYVASKHALVGLTKHVAVTYQDQGIRCNAVAPGSIATNISEAMTGEVNQKVLDNLNKNMGTFTMTAQPYEIANVMLFLASEEASFVNGEILVADGGITAF